MKQALAACAGVAAFAWLSAAPRPVHAEPFTRKAFVLPEGAFEITGDPARPWIAGHGVSKDVTGPLYLAPHFYWGVSDDLSLGISHATGLCLRGCDKTYNDAGFDLMWWLTGSDHFELDLHAGAPVRSFDPFFLGAQAGVLGRVNFGPVVALVFDPALYVALTERDAGNEDGLLLPFWFYFQVTPEIAPFVGSSLAGPLDGFSDQLQVPFEAGVLFSVSRDVDLGVAFRFANLLGRNATSEVREIGLLARFRL